MTEQVEAPQGTPNQRVEDSLTSMFMGEPQGGEPSGRPRDPETGRFAPTGRQEQQPVQADGQETEQQGQETAPPQSEDTVEVEFEFDGAKEIYALPRKISDRFIQHADYTRKTQDLAEMRRALSAEREAFNLSQAFEQSIGQERQQLGLYEMQLAQFQNVNWATMETEQLLRTRAQLDQLRDAKTQLENTIKGKRGEFDARVKGVAQEALVAGQKYIEQKIKGYDQSTQKVLFEYGLAEGYTREEMGSIRDPRIIVSLWKAQQWDNLQTSKPGVLNKAAKAAPVIRPGATQQQPSRVQQLNKAFTQAKSGKDKQAAAEDYFAQRFG